MTSSRTKLAQSAGRGQVPSGVAPSDKTSLGQEKSGGNPHSGSILRPGKLGETRCGQSTGQWLV